MQPNFPQFKQGPDMKLQQDVATPVLKFVSKYNNPQISEDLDEPDIKDNDVVLEYDSQQFEELISVYYMQSQIGDFLYRFSLKERVDKPDDFVLLFKTIPYEFAITDLNKQDTEKLFKKLAEFLETVYNHSAVFNQFIFSAAVQSYTVDDVNWCVDEILKSDTTQKYTREFLLEKYKGVDIFYKYQEMTGKLHSYSINREDRSAARKRYFRIYFAKYFKNWQIKENSEGKRGFRMIRKSDLTDTQNEVKTLASD
jgi:hypothetical protein